MAERVSVALCTHNGERHLAEQLRSVLDQTRPVDEIVIADDASTDGTRRIVEAFRADADPSLRVIVLHHDPPLGVTKNFESAIAATSGDVVLLCDQDDVWSRDKVEVLVRELQTDGALLVHTDARIVDDSGAPTGDTLFGTLAVSEAELAQEEAGDGLRVLLRRNIVTGATCAFRRELAQAAMPFPDSWVHDEWLAMQAALRGGLRVSRRTLTDYRIHGANQIGAERLTRQTAIARLRAQRTERNARLLARATDLAVRFEQEDPGSPNVALLEEKRAHEVARSAYPASRLRRPIAVLREWATGRYSRFGGGMRDVLRDLVQPV
jgi:glycosyltransferase involved in cell wall biosynthesis